jgi:hypothetical protein
MLEQTTPPNVDYFDDAHLKYYFACVRGVSGGFIQGLYDNTTETVSKDCLGDTTFKHMSDLKAMLVSGDILQLFKSVGTVYQLGYDI